jgi:hypothetical protein
MQQTPHVWRRGADIAPPRDSCYDVARRHSLRRSRGTHVDCRKVVGLDTVLHCFSIREEGFAPPDTALIPPISIEPVIFRMHWTPQDTYRLAFVRAVL